MPEHADITDPDLHECKGAAAASVNTVPQADGAGSTTWGLIGTANLDTTELFNTNKFQLTVSFPDVSTADTILVSLPFACTLNRATTILNNAITVADAVVTFINSTGPSTIGSVTVAQSGSAEGDKDTLTAAANNSFTAGTHLKITTDGGSTTTAKLLILLEFTRTAA
jgi:Mg2+/citrate symporter